MMVSAMVDPSVRDAFEAWHRDVHLPHALRIPGVQGGQRLSGPMGSPNYMMVYDFASEADVRAAFASEEAQTARADWEQWVDSVRDFTVGVYTELVVNVPVTWAN